MQPDQILQEALAHITAAPEKPVTMDSDVRDRLVYVVECLSNRAGVRLLMSCLLAKLDKPSVDVRKPYTEIGSDDSFSGRTYDEQFLTGFISQNRLPCNATTAYLTPTLRNMDRPLTVDTMPIGRPRDLYRAAAALLDDIHTARVSPRDLLHETIRLLVALRDEQDRRMAELKGALKCGEGRLALASEGVVALIEQHMRCKSASRIPVLVVAAAYASAGRRLGEQIKPLHGHNAADLQTRALGDVEVYLENDEDVVTAYEMKMKRVSADDIDAALSKIEAGESRVDNYIFITTEQVDEQVTEYAAGLYEETGGIEIAILDCMGFLRHFLHLFHRLRMDFLDTYQALVLDEPDSAVSQPLKEAFLALRRAAEVGE